MLTIYFFKKNAGDSWKLDEKSHSHRLGHSQHPGTAREAVSVFRFKHTLMRIVLFPSMNAALSLSLGAARLPETVQTRRAGAALKNSAGFRFGWPS